MQRANKEIVTLNGVSPGELGWQASSIRTALINEPLAIRAKAGRRGETIYMCKFRPLKGEWLGQALTSATTEPDKPSRSGVIRADWELFQEAHQEQELIAQGKLDPAQVINSKVRILHRHITDPSIGTSMRRFGSDYVDLWLQALGDNNSALQRAFIPLVITDGRYFPDHFIHERDNSQKIIGDLFYHPNSKLSTVLEFRRSIPSGLYGYQYNFTREEFFAFSEWLKNSSPGRNRLRSKLIPYLVKNEGTDVIDTYPLDTEDRSNFSIHSIYTNYSKRGRYSWNSSFWKWPKYTISNNAITLFEADTQVKIALEQTNNPAVPYAIVGQQVDFTDKSNAISPALAWRHTLDPSTGTVKRIFLTRDQMINQFASEFPGEVLDDWLGLVTSVGFMPRVREHTHAQLHLKNESRSVRLNGGQAIDAAQIPVYYNREVKRRRIAQDPDGVLASIEDLAA